MLTFKPIFGVGSTHYCKILKILYCPRLNFQTLPSLSRFHLPHSQLPARVLFTGHTFADMHLTELSVQRVTLAINRGYLSCQFAFP